MLQSYTAARYASGAALLFFFVLTLRAETVAFPPSQPYRAQLAERGAVRDLSLRDAITTALQSNLDIEMERDNRETSHTGIANANSYYDPIFDLTGTALTSNIPVTNILQTGGFYSQITKAYTAVPSIQENLPGGGTAQLSLNLSRTYTNSYYALINPVYGSVLGITITQPLWRGFRRTAAERQIIVARLNESMSESEFRQRVAGTVEQVINTYWRLAIALENYESQRQSRDVAVAEYEQTRKEQKQGQEGALASQRSDVVAHDQSLTQAEVQVVQAENALKRLLTASIMDPLWTTGIIASDRPTPREPDMTEQDAVQTALQRRPELEQLRLQLKQSEADVRYNRQETKPAVNLRLEAQSTSYAGPIADTVDITGPLPAITGAFGTTTRQAISFDHPSLAAGLEIRLPLRNLAAKSQLAAAVIGERKLQAQFRAAQEDILVDVRNAWQTIAVQRRNADSAVQSRKAAEERVHSEEAKHANEPGALDVLRARKDFEEARKNELQALVDYQLSLVTLQRAMNTLVDEQQIVLARRK